MTAPHVPVLLAEVIAALQPARGGTFLDGTFGAGGYTAALLAGGASHVIAIDRDPNAIARGQAMVADHAPRLTLLEGCFGTLDTLAADHGPLAGVVLDIGVSSMQIDEAARGFSFMRDGPLDMRMAQDGPTAADIVNHAAEAELAEILFLYGEERASRRIARAILAARAEAPIERTAGWPRSLPVSCRIRARVSPTRPRAASRPCGSR
jgi:16S rRNA (cytosine1402-N4)-methyltransferase